MKVDYTPRAKTDLVEIGEYSRKTFGLAVASALETYMRATVAALPRCRKAACLFLTAKACV